MQMRTVRPYSWRTLESIPRADAALLRDVRRWADRRWPLRALRDAFREVLGAPVDVIVRRAKPMASAGDFGDGLAILFAHGDLASAEERVLVHVEPALATDLVARALRRPVPAVVVERGSGGAGFRAAPLAGLAGLAGAFAAVLMAAARRTRAPRGEGPLRILSAGDAVSLGSDAGWPDPSRAIAVAFTVVVGDNAYSARAVFLRPTADAFAAFAWTRPALAALGDARLALRIVASTVEASAVDVAALRPGDVLVPGTIAIARSRAGSWTGPVSLAAPGGDATVRAELAEGERLVLRAGPKGPVEGPMDEHEASPSLVEALGEIPVVVRVEIGRVEMLAREWAAVGEGDVISLGHPVGQPVLLRVGSQVVARGDLVEVDGEVGVRVTDRLAASVTSNGEEPVR
jgi:type III secretion protein Q